MQNVIGLATEQTTNVMIIMEINIICLEKKMETAIIKKTINQERQLIVNGQMENLTAKIFNKLYLNKKIIFFFIIIFGVFFISSSKADMRNDTYNLVLKAQNCYFSLPSYAQEGAIDSWLDAKKYWNDAVKEDNMGDPRNLAGAFYRNAGAYAGVVLQIGSAYGNQNCK